jgi:hypothetical protein
VQDAEPVLAADERGLVESLLEAAFEQHSLHVAGPPVTYDPKAGIAAAQVLARACWLHAIGNESDTVALNLEADPCSSGAHLSADVTLRFLPAVLRRARARQAESGLVKALDRILRAWPLSGVLADLDGTPTATLDFGGHPGLQLLYAERLAATDRVGWLPPPGPAREWVERVYHERGIPIPALVLEEDDCA